jgi:hypothetical protein
MGPISVSDWFTTWNADWFITWERSLITRTLFFDHSNDECLLNKEFVDADVQSMERPNETVKSEPELEKGGE